jgi:hypothetical protein
VTLALVIEMLVNGNDLSINQEVLGCVYRESLTGLSTYSMNLSSKDRGKWDELVKLETKWRSSFGSPLLLIRSLNEVPGRRFARISRN